MILTIKRGVGTLTTIEIDENTIFSKKLMVEDKITAIFTVDVAIDFQIDDFITYDSKNYYINRLPNYKVVNLTSFGYIVDFESNFYDLGKKLFISSDGLIEWDYNGSATDYVTRIVANMNDIDSGWSVGTIDSSDDKTMTFSEEYCLNSLTRIAEEFSMEFEIDGKEINLKNSIGSDTLYTFEYGRDNGLYSLERQQISNQNIITKCYGFGGDTNIPYDYRSRARVLVFEDRFLLKNVSLYGTIEGIYRNEDIYPQRTSTLTASSIDFDAGGGTDFNHKTSYIEDSTIDFDINDYLIEGEIATIVFKSGDLEGIECEIWKYDHSNKRIYFNPYSDADGYTLPFYNAGSEIQPEIGDSYTLVNISMPQSYIDTAETTLETETQAYLEENCVPQVVYSCDIDPRYIATEGINLSVGDRVTVVDTGLGINTLIRISELSFPLVNPDDISTTIADFVPYTVSQRIVQSAIINKKETTVVNIRQTELARRNTMRQTQLKGLLFDTDEYFDPTNLRPLSLETLYLAVGTKSSDFWLSDVIIQTNYGGDENAVYISNTANDAGGFLDHLQISIDGLGSTWVITSQLNASLLTPATPYYLYVKCSTTALTATWVISDSQITVESESGFYHFYAGNIFAVDNGRRDYSLVSGMTYIVGDTITTGKIQSIDGLNYFGLTDGTFKVGDSNASLDWNVTTADTLTLKGALVQSPAGSTFPIGSYRGVYGSGTTYYKGDVITYGGSTWRYINTTPGAGHTPSDNIYWDYIANKGDTGLTGADGGDGSDGVDARGVNLTSVVQGFNYDTNGANPSPSNTTITATAVNTTGTVYYRFYLNDVLDTGGSPYTSNTHTYTPQADYDNMPDKIEVEISEESDGTPILARDQITMSGLKAGVDSITIILSNEAHTLPTTNGGTVTYTGSGTTIRVYEGSTELIYDGVGTSDGTWKVTATPTNITTGSITDSGNYATVADHSSMTQNNASISYLIEGKSSTGVAISITKIQSFAKSVEGDDGATGDAGAGVVYRGVYDDSGATTYYSSSIRRDVVKGTNGQYYICKLTDTGSSANEPITGGSYTTYWEAFGATFSSVATDILFASVAYIDNLGVRILKTADSGTNRVEIGEDSSSYIRLYSAADDLIINLEAPTGGGVLEFKNSSGNTLFKAAPSIFYARTAEASGIPSSTELRIDYYTVKITGLEIGETGSSGSSTNILYIDNVSKILKWKDTSSNILDVNTNTYAIDAVDSGDDAIIRLTASGASTTTDDVKLVSGANITITPSGDNITIATENLVSNDTTSEPTGSDSVVKVVSLTQAEYDAGTPVSTTLYIITT